jgi:hypothetical protein
MVCGGWREELTRWCRYHHDGKHNVMTVGPPIEIFGAYTSSPSTPYALTMPITPSRTPYERRRPPRSLQNPHVHRRPNARLRPPRHPHLRTPPHPRLPPHPFLLLHRQLHLPHHPSRNFSHVNRTYPFRPGRFRHLLAGRSGSYSVRYS